MSVGQSFARSCLVLSAPVIEEARCLVARGHEFHMECFVIHWIYLLCPWNKERLGNVGDTEEKLGGVNKRTSSQSQSSRPIKSSAFCVLHSALSALALSPCPSQGLGCLVPPRPRRKRKKRRSREVKMIQTARATSLRPRLVRTRCRRARG